MAMKKKKGFAIGIAGGHREYEINDVVYVVSGRYADPTHTEADKTLADTVEGILESEFTDLTPAPEKPKMKSKPVRSAAGRER